jgi:uncharacterized protein (DUF488 family)
MQELIAMLTAHGVQQLIDVRTIPRSRYNPQFNREAMPEPLAAAGIEYIHMPGLGGMRHPRRDSINTGWKNLSFRGYADHMQTPEFQRDLAELTRLGGQKTTAVMCAESVPWRCHRSLIADALTAHGVPVLHIMSASRLDPHRLTSFARVESTNVTYPSADLDLFS